MDNFRKSQLLRLYNWFFWGSLPFFPCLWAGVLGLYIYRGNPQKAILWFCGAITVGILLFFFVHAVYRRDTYGAPWAKGLVSGIMVWATSAWIGTIVEMAKDSLAPIIVLSPLGFVLGILAMVFVTLIYYPCRPDA